MVLPTVTASLRECLHLRFQMTTTNSVKAPRLLREHRATLAGVDISELESAELPEVVPLRRPPLICRARPGLPLPGLGQRPALAEVFRYPTALCPAPASRFSSHFAKMHTGGNGGFCAVMAPPSYASSTTEAQPDAIVIDTFGSARLFRTAGLVPLAGANA